MILSSLISSAALLGVSWADFEKEPSVAARAPLEPGRTIAGFEVENPRVEWTAYVEPKDDNPFPARPAVRTRFATSLSASELQPPSPWAAEAGDAPRAPARTSPPLPSKAAPVYASPQSVTVAQSPMGYVPQTVAYSQPAYYAAPVASYAVVGDPGAYPTQIVVGGRRGPLRGLGRALFGTRQVAAYGDAGSYGYATAQPYGAGYGYSPTYSYAAQPRVYAYGGGYRAMVCGPNGCY
jgi:hypothetical protein